VAQAARSENDLYSGPSGPKEEENHGRTRTKDRAPDPLIGRVIADRYRIVGHLGRGGMGVVYKVEHLRIGKLMAMKLLTGELSRNREVVRRFKREALAASRLTSVNTVQVWDFGHSDGLTYLVMELVAGEDLGKVLKREGPLPFPRIAQIAVQVCNSMREAHERGIVHRDIKPENILVLHPSGSIDEEEERARAEARQLTDLVKVLDFGLAKLHDEERPHTNDVTTVGAIVGTPFYMSPEQIRGEVVDGRADIYALGAVMYRALCGVPPFTAPTPMAVITQHLTERLIPPHERTPELKIPREVSDIIVKAMAKDRDERYANASELREVLITHLATLGVSGGFLRTGALESLAATGVPETLRSSRVDTEVSVPLATRREVDAYSKRRRRAGIIATAIALASVATVLIGVRTMRGGSNAAHAPGEEDEPNDTTASPNKLALGSPSRGYIGKRLAPDKGDVDVWSIEVPSGMPDPLLEIALAPLPNIPLCVELFDEAANVKGLPIASFCRPRGVGLHVSAFHVQPGRHWLRVLQDRSVLEDGGKPPVYENVSDMYSLRVAVASKTADLEVEPNDGLGNAQTLALGDGVQASLAWRGDRDFFCATGTEGEGRFVVVDRSGSGIPRFDITTFVDGAQKTKAAPDTQGTWKSAPFPLTQRMCISISSRDATGRLDDFYRVSIERP
jgi:eukaryotic-like serine/threonine-protein kinase